MCGKFAVLGVDIVRVGLDDMMAMVDDLAPGGMLCVWQPVNSPRGPKVRENSGNGEGKSEVQEGCRRVGRQMPKYMKTVRRAGGGSNGRGSALETAGAKSSSPRAGV